MYRRAFYWPIQITADMLTSQLARPGMDNPVINSIFVLEITPMNFFQMFEMLMTNFHELKYSPFFVVKIEKKNTA